LVYAAQSVEAAAPVNVRWLCERGSKANAAKSTIYLNL
jgi:hypothetical protein